MNDQLLATFIALVNFDQKIRALQDEREALITLRSALDEQKTLLMQNLETLKNQVHDVKRMLMRKNW